MKPIQAALLLSTSTLLAADPVITTETRQIDDEPVIFMWIDGVLVHETDPEIQPQPKVVTPPPYDADAAKPPKGAVILFDGSEESFRKNWKPQDEKAENRWRFINGTMESVAKAGYLTTKQEFGSCRLHVEFATPSKVKGKGQGRGNSGVIFMDRYEVQVLDSYKNTTYPDGQCAALYGRSVPKVNVSRPPGEWQTYDITFHRPLFGEDGKVVRKARMNVIHNGVLVQDDVELSGTTRWMGPHAVQPYDKHADKMSISLQDHGNPVKFRNIWLIPIEE